MAAEPSSSTEAPASSKVFALKPVVVAAVAHEVIAQPKTSYENQEGVKGLDEEPLSSISPEALLEAEPEPQAAVSPFEISATLTPEPQTNSIVIADVPDPIRMGDIVTDAGLILRTGSIEIVPVTTGQIEIIPESPESDVADSIDSSDSFVPSLAPVRASGVMNSKLQAGARPPRRRRFTDATVTSVTLGIVILALTAAGVISYMLGILR